MSDPDGPPFFLRYTRLVPESDLIESLRIQLDPMLDRLNRCSDDILLQFEEARVALTGGGTTVARLANGRAAPGEAVDVFVRPEAIALGRPGAVRSEHTNRLEGTVDSLLFNGANSRILVRSGEELIEVDLIHLDGGEVRPGDPVELSWAPSRALAFRTAG
jgi:spermidine/putrescine transport system ATP-binding protein